MSTHPKIQKRHDANLLIISSSFPLCPESHEGGFIFELVKRVDSTLFQPLILAPHFHKAPIHESWHHVRIFRFPYFFPFRFEQLAYGSGIAINIRKNPFILFSLPFFFLSEFLFSLYITKKNPISVIHTHWFIPQGLIGGILHCLMNTPHIATIHGSDINFIKNHPILHPLCRFITRNTDAITVNSTFMHRRLLDIDPRCSHKISIIPMGVDFELFKNHITDKICNKYPHNKIILSVGRLIDWKGTIYLIDAMKDVLNVFPDAILIIIGEGPEKEHLQEKILELGISESVQMPGFVRSEDLPSYYHAADVFVLPSINIEGRTEGLGVVLLEAMASGCPVVGSNVGGIPDIIKDGENGYLVPEKDSHSIAERIIRILSDKSLQEKLRKNGLILVEKKFSWNNISEQFISVYYSLLKNKV